ncbi:hypothetical protein A0J61_11212 [Choanephora cucurbitarum]|uniref:Chromo domain-containing protein n=1 Tax=Choanephora cucurbitarum TaxID=101091 RepID=A0A1C7MWD5_9FUNG|nr:hypothetical protein A0J61_11212 [Choanephora cucurbitarum]
MIKSVEKKNSAKYEPKNEGPFQIHDYTDNGSYILTDRTNALLTIDIPTSHIKLIEDDDAENEGEHYEVEAIIDHRGNEPNHEYKVRWKGYTRNDDTWEKAENYYYYEPTRQYGARRNVNDKHRKRLLKTINKRKVQNRNEKRRMRSRA